MPNIDDSAINKIDNEYDSVDDEEEDDEENSQLSHLFTSDAEDIHL